MLSSLPATVCGWLLITAFSLGSLMAFLKALEKIHSKENWYKWGIISGILFANYSFLVIVLLIS